MGVPAAVVRVELRPIGNEDAQVPLLPVVQEPSKGSALRLVVGLLADPLEKIGACLCTCHQARIVGQHAQNLLDETTSADILRADDVPSIGIIPAVEVTVRACAIEPPSVDRERIDRLAKRLRDHIPLSTCYVIPHEIPIRGGAAVEVAVMHHEVPNSRLVSIGLRADLNPGVAQDAVPSD